MTVRCGSDSKRGRVRGATSYTNPRRLVSSVSSSGRRRSWDRTSPRRRGQEEAKTREWTVLTPAVRSSTLYQFG